MRPFSGWLLVCRNRRGLSRRGLAARLGVPEALVARLGVPEAVVAGLESGQIRPDAQMVQYLIATLAIPSVDQAAFAQAAGVPWDVGASAGLEH